MMRFAIAAALVFAGMPSLASAQEGETRACTFNELSVEEQKRYQSRYKRRVNNEGQAFADAWLFDQVCLTAEERKAKNRKPLLDKDGKPCTKTRMEMRVTPGYDGAMSMTPITVCAN